MRGLSLVVASRGYISCRVRASHFGGLLPSTSSRCVGLVAPWHVGSSRTRARTCVPCIGRRILNHCSTRGVPHSFNYGLQHLTEFGLITAGLESFITQQESQPQVLLFPMQSLHLFCLLVVSRKPGGFGSNSTQCC